MPEYDVLTIKQQKQHQKLHHLLNIPLISTNQANVASSSRLTDTVRSNTENSNSTFGYTHIPGSETERVRLCGNLFDRRTTITQEIVDEFFRREPCPYGKIIIRI